MKIIITIMMFLSLLCTTGCQKDHKVKVGIAAVYPPFEFEKENNIVGFDVDLMNAIAQDANLNIEYVNMPFNELLPALENNKINFAISAINRSPERLKNYDFSIPYYQAQALVWVYRKGEPLLLEGETSQKVGVQKGTLFETLVSQKQDKYEILAYDTTAAVIEKLQQREINAAMVEKLQAEQFCKSDPNLTYQNAGIVDGYAITFKKGSPLVAQINGSLKKLQTIGFLEVLEKKWLQS